MTGKRRLNDSESVAPRSPGEVYDGNVQILHDIQIEKARLHARELAAVLAIRDNAECAMIPGAKPGSIRPHGVGDRGDKWVELEDIAAADIAIAMTVGDRQARGLVHTAVKARTHYPTVTTALQDGVFSEHKLRILHKELGECDEELARKVTQQVLPRAGTNTPSQFQTRVRAALIRLAPNQVAERRKASFADRYVSVRPEADGSAMLFAQHSALMFTTLDRALTDLANTSRRPEDTRTVQQRRVDALVAAIVGPGAFHSAEDFQSTLDFDEDGSFTVDSAETDTVTAHIERVQREANAQLEPADWTIYARPKVTIDVHIPAHVLAGSDLPTATQTSVASIDGLGPIDPDLARSLAKDARWRRVITDPATGIVLNSTAKADTYAFPTGTARLIRTRDKHCRFPGCTRTARACDIDHVTPYPAGPTTPTNALTLCRRHHRLKHQTTWTVTTSPDSTATWTSPTGRTHVTTPPPDD